MKNILYNTFILLLIILFCTTSAQARKKDNISGLYADSIVYNQANNDFEAIGNIYIISDRYIILADKLLYDSKNDKIWGQDVQIIDKDGNKYLGHGFIMEQKYKDWIAKDVAVYQNNNSVFAANLIHSFNDKIYLLKANYTACNICKNANPFWQITSDKVTIDKKNEIVAYKNAWLKIYNVPVLFFPYFAHPAPKAKAKSGLLTPKIKKNKVKIPLYWRIQNNLDLTFSPLIGTKQIVYETNLRHLLAHGKYNIDTSISGTKKSNIKYYLTSKGNFNFKEWNYGVDINYVNDVAFLRNYYQKYNSYYDSRIYLNHINQEDYYRYQAIGINDLRTAKLAEDKIFIPIVFDFNKIYHHNDQSDFEIKYNVMRYQQNKLQVNRMILISSLSKNFYYHNQRFTVKGQLRNGLYDIVKNKNNSLRKKQFIHHVPELGFSWNYKELLFNSKDSIIFIKPQVAFIATVPIKSNKHQSYIDKGNLNINLHNLYNNNHYSGIDIYDDCNRVIYGINSSFNKLINNNWAKLGFYLGKLDYSKSKHNMPKNYFIGETNLQYEKILLYYRFYKNKTTSYKDQIGLGYRNNRINIKTEYNIASEKQFDNKNKIKQIINTISYKINDMWNIAYNDRWQLVPINKKLLDSITLTYSNECVKLSIGASYINMQDLSRNISKNNWFKGFSLYLGFRTINY